MKRVALDFDCKQVADNVRGLGRMGKWESRSDEFPFYTLGKSAYLDGNSGTFIYFLLTQNSYRYLETGTWTLRMKRLA